MTELRWHDTQWQPATAWPVADRALHYGDGLFETIRLNAAGEAPLWSYHRQRMLQGLVALDFPIDSWALIESAWRALPISTRQAGAGKLLISRGAGPRGYGPPAEPRVELLWQPFTPASWANQRYPQGFTAGFSDVALSRQPLLAGFKHLNRLEQVLARSRFPADCQEMIMCDTAGQTVEGCMSNLFIWRSGVLLTPSVMQSGVNGVVRRWLLERMPVTEADIQPADLLQAESLFFCNTLNGIIPVYELAGQRYDRHSPGWVESEKLQRQLEALFC